MRNPKFNAAWKFGIVIAFVLAAASPAPAFYWTLRVVPSLVTPNENPSNPPIPGADPLPLPPDTVVPTGGPETPGDPTGAPEPATAAAGVIGLAALGLRRLFTRR